MSVHTKKRGVSQQLQTIDALLAEKLPAVAASLRPPTKTRDLAKLAKWFGGKVPPDLASWFGWHDGQDTSTFQSLVPDTSWSALSCADALAANATLTAESPDGIMQPWRATWLPLFENGGSDHLCLDRASGALIAWYHDDAMRPKEHRDLATLIARLERAYQKLKKPKRIAPPPDRLTWRRSGVPTEPTFAALPVGTVYRYAATYPSGRSVELKIKLGADRWLECSSRTLTGALAHWRELAASPPAKSAGYYSDDDNVRWYLGQARKTLQIAVKA